MEEEVRPGFLPPQAPGGIAPPQFQPPAPAPPPPGPNEVQRPVFVAQRMEAGPRSPLALSGTIVGAIALLLLLLTVGVGYAVTGIMGAVAIMFGILARAQIRDAGVGRAGQARAAIWIGGIALGLSIVAFIVWTVLDASGFTPQDLQQWLEERLEEERSRSRGGAEDARTLS